MKTSEPADKLIEEAFENPALFSERGKPYKLLQYYFKGYDIQSLYPFLHSKDPYLQSIATFIISELGSNAAELIVDFLPLVNSENLSIRYEVVESIMACSFGSQADKFRYVVEAMEDIEIVLRTRAMRLMVNAEEEQIKAVLDFFRNQGSESGRQHYLGLVQMLEGIDGNPDIVETWLKSEYEFLRKYAAVLAKINFERYPFLLKDALSSDDLDIQTFAEQTYDS